MYKPSDTDTDCNLKLFTEAACTLRDYLRRHNIRSALLGVSGGADSTLLYLMFSEAIADIPDFRLGVAHANFHLRGEESQRDRKFVENLIASYPRPDSMLFIKDFDTVGYCTKNRLSIEMGARELRHDWWRDLIREHSFDRIVTGHNADDNVETLLLNLLRGSGVRGLKGMMYDDGLILRPLLNYSRQTILDFLDILNSEHVEDSTNKDSDYRRNFLRNRVIPLLKEAWPGATKSLLKTQHLVSEENKIVEASINSIIGNLPATLSITTILQYPSPLTLIYRWIAPYGGNTDMAEEICRVIENGEMHGQRWLLHPDTDSDAKYSIIASPSELRREEAGTVYMSEVDNYNPFKGFNITHHSTITENDRVRIRHTSPDELCIPYPPDQYYWRSPRQGERMMLFSASRGGTAPRKSKLISDILKEARIPLAERRYIRVLANRDTDKPVWIPGIRRGGTDLIEDFHTEFWMISKFEKLPISYF